MAEYVNQFKGQYAEYRYADAVEARLARWGFPWLAGRLCADATDSVTDTAYKVLFDFVSLFFHRRFVVPHHELDDAKKAKLVEMLRERINKEEARSAERYDRLDEITKPGSWLSDLYARYRAESVENLATKRRMIDAFEAMPILPSGQGIYITKGLDD